MTDVKVARVFDGLDGTGEPRFAPDHPTVGDPAERERTLAYLNAGRPILMTTALEVDRMDRSRGEAVPLSFRTDGAWIWTDSVAYYLEVHGLAPDPDLTAHIAAHEYACPAVDDAAAARALRALYRPPAAYEATAAGSGESPDFTVTGGHLPPITLTGPNGATLDVAPDLTPEEFEILERMRRDLGEPRTGA